jgi:hypothetical protein
MMMEAAAVGGGSMLQLLLTVVVVGREGKGGWSGVVCDGGLGCAGRCGWGHVRVAVFGSPACVWQCAWRVCSAQPAGLVVEVFGGLAQQPGL